jgi:hypothetical protein
LSSESEAHWPLPLSTLELSAYIPVSQFSVLSSQVSPHFSLHFMI